MDPLTMANQLAVLVGLLCSFKQESGANKDASHKEFMAWLETHRHNELKDLISETHHLQTEIDEILLRDHKEILEKLDTVNTALASLLSHVEGFSELASTFSSADELSEQAIRILVAFEVTNSNIMVGFRHQHGYQLSLDSGSINLTDQRFVEDDLNTLIAFGLISIRDYNRSGEPVYVLTRAGSKYARTVAGSIEEPRPNEDSNDGEPQR